MTIEKLLMHVEPWQIFVGDNGSTPQQVQATEFACEVISEQYRLKYPDYVNEGNINFGSIREGSKTMAQFCTAYNILATHPHIKYVTMLDDDTLVPDCRPLHDCGIWSHRHPVSNASVLALRL